MGKLRTSHADINTSSFLSAVGSHSELINCKEGSRLKHVHVEFGSSADWSIGTTWIQMGLDLSVNLVPPALVFLCEGTMDVYGGNPSWDGDLPIYPGLTIFIDCLEGGTARQLRMVWTWEED